MEGAGSGMSDQKIAEMEKLNERNNSAKEENQTECRTQDDVKRVVDMALEAGRILLRNGGEIFRVEETITRICHHFGVEHVDIFTLSHGIFVSAENEKGNAYTKVKHIPLSGAHIGVVAEVNELSRQIAEGKVSVSEAEERLKEIDRMSSSRKEFQVLAAGAAAFQDETISACGLGGGSPTFHPHHAGSLQCCSPTRSPSLHTCLCSSISALLPSSVCPSVCPLHLSTCFICLYVCMSV